MKLTDKEIKKANDIVAAARNDTKVGELIIAAFDAPTDKKAVKAARKEIARLDMAFAKIQAIIDKPKEGTS
jgi:hypothetical protein